MKSKENADRIYSYFDKRGMMGNKNNLEIERRFLVSPKMTFTDAIEILGNEQIQEIRQIYLLSDGPFGQRVRSIVKLRHRTTSYFWTKKKPTKNPAVKIEIEKKISYKKFKKLLRSADAERNELIKFRIIFFYKKQKFELDFFASPARICGLAILEIELKRPDQKVELPPLIPIACEITGMLSNSYLAKRPH